jgi:hypothetical protein
LSSINLHLLAIIFGEFVSNVTGAKGEMNVSLCLMRDINGKPLFSVRPLGEKAELLDFVVNLLDDKESEVGAFFMIQVKATKSAEAGKSIDVNFDADQVAKALNRKVPVYLMAVDMGGGRAREIYFVAVDNLREKGFRAVPRVHNLDCDITLRALYDEVVAYHDVKGHNFVSNFGDGRV